MIPLAALAASPLMWRVIGAAAAAVALVGAVTWGVSAIYGAGKEAGESKGEAKLQAAVADSERRRGDTLERLLAARERIASMQAEADQREAAALKKGMAQAKTVERVIRENPAFAAIVRPADLGSVRDDQLADVAAAASRSAELSAASLRGVRSPGAP